MQEPLEGMSFNFALSVMPSDTERASVPSIAESFNEEDPVHGTPSGSSGSTFSNVETLQLFSQRLDVKFDQNKLSSNAYIYICITPHHSATLNTETRPYSASTSGPSKTMTPNTLFPGAFSPHTRRITAQAKDVTFAFKKNSLSSANPSYQHLTNVMNSYHLAATETKPSYETTNPLNFALHILCKLYCI